MMATTRGSVASRSQSISFFSNGSIAMAIFGFFHGSLNSGDWAKTVSEKNERKKAKKVRVLRVMFDIDEATRKLREVFVDVFTVQEANKHENITGERDAEPIVSDANAIVITTAFQLFQI